MKHQPDRAGRTAVLMEPHPFCHAAIQSLLSRVDTAVVGAATTAGAADALLEELVPSMLVAELDLPEGRKAALRVISRGRQANPALTVIVLSGSDDGALIEEAFVAGASAYILKTADADAVATAMRQAFEPSIYLARPSAARSAPVPAPGAADRIVPQLTRRELEILQLVSEGRSNRQVGQLLWVTDQTVKFHLANIYRKLGVGSRYDAARWAEENGVLEVAFEEVEGAEIVPLNETTGNGNGRTRPADGNGTENGNGTVPLRLRRTTPGGLRPRAELREGTSR